MFTPQYRGDMGHDTVQGNGAPSAVNDQPTTGAERVAARIPSPVTYQQAVATATRVGLTRAELAAITGSGVRAVQNWAAGNATPRPEAARRLLDVSTITGLLCDTYTDEGIGIWLRNRNARLDLHRPIDLLTEGRIDEVIEQARWVAGAW
jgi:DNA-binding transcriptional regulator YiaG